MDALRALERRQSTIRNKCWWVRHYCRPMQKRERAQAIAELGLAVREAFNATDDFEPLLVAIVDGLAPLEERARF